MKNLLKVIVWSFIALCNPHDVQNYMHRDLVRKEKLFVLAIALAVLVIVVAWVKGS